MPVAIVGSGGTYVRANNYGGTSILVVVKPNYRRRSMRRQATDHPRYGWTKGYMSGEMPVCLESV
jgi:hypothetical protein